MTWESSEPLSYWVKRVLRGRSLVFLEAAPDVRRQVIEALVPEVTELLQELASGNVHRPSKYLADIARSLAELGPEYIRMILPQAETILSLIASEHTDGWTHLVLQAEAYSDAAYRRLFGHPRWEVRADAVGVCRWHGDVTSAIEELLRTQLLTENDEHVQRAIQAALAKA